MFIANHLHLLVKGYVSNPPIKEEELNQWFIELVEKVRMKVVGGPTSVYVHEEGNEGLTGTITLSTSHSSIHIWDNKRPSLFQFDLYSCSCFTPEEVLEHLDKFGLVSYEWIFIDRNNKMEIVESGKKDE
jgi:S-adenosylmethionine/arginine decarboxylase-like enzyme